MYVILVLQRITQNEIISRKDSIIREDFILNNKPDQV